MRKKFKNIENDEEFKNFKLEDYLPSMNRREPKADASVSEQEAAVEEEANLFPPLDEPDTSSIQEAVFQAIQQDAQEVWETSDTDEKIKDTPCRGRGSSGTDDCQTHQQQAAQAVVG